MKENKQNFFEIERLRDPPHQKFNWETERLDRRDTIRDKQHQAVSFETEIVTK